MIIIIIIDDVVVVGVVDHTPKSVSQIPWPPNLPVIKIPIPKKECTRQPAKNRKTGKGKKAVSLIHTP